MILWGVGTKAHKVGFLSRPTLSWNDPSHLVSPWVYLSHTPSQTVIYAAEWGGESICWYIHKRERAQAQAVSAHANWSRRRQLQRRAAHTPKEEATARSEKKDPGGFEGAYKTTELLESAGLCVSLMSPSHSGMTKRRPRTPCVLRV